LAVETLAKVFSALRNLGFRERGVRAALGGLREQQGTLELDAKSLLRQALVYLGQSAHGS
jgi:hypothetical protein